MYEQRAVGTLTGDANGLMTHYANLQSYLLRPLFSPRHIESTYAGGTAPKHELCGSARQDLRNECARESRGVVIPVDYGIGTLELLRRLIEKRFDDGQNPVYDHVLRVATKFGSALMVRSSLCCGHWAKEMLKRRYKQRRGRGEIGMREGDLLLLSFEARDDDQWQETQNK
jgi:hypothetical protein